MAGGGVIADLLLLLLLVAVLLAVLAYRHRLAFRIGVRNTLRARRRTALLIAGLLVATTIISGSLVVGDTIDTLAVHYTVLAVGHTDEVIGNQSASGGYTFFPASVAASVAAATSSDPEIAGVTPEIVASASVLDRTTGIPQVNLYLIGVNESPDSPLGPFVATSGATVAGPAPGEVILDALAASELNASAGDALDVFGATPQPVPLVVQAIAEDDQRAAFPTGGVGNYGSIFTNLSTAQALEREPNAINFLAVTNTGDQAERLAHASAVSATLNATLATIPAAKGLGVDELLTNALATEEATGSGVTTLFLVLGLFSIAAGALLIVGIFLLLAEERKGEMGVLRALGLRGNELVYAFLFEGAIYSAGSALAGTALGVGVGYGLTYAFSVLISEPGLSASALLGSFTVLPSSLVIAYTSGFLLTLATVGLASRRASHLNIVRAVRDLPEPDPPIRTYTLLAGLGVLVAVLGLLLYRATYRGASPLSEPVLGGALLIVGLGLVATRFVRNRWAFTAVGVGLLIWAGDESLRIALIGSTHGGGIYGVFVEGIILVAGGVLLYASNSATIVAGLLKLVEGREGRAPVALIGLAYPGRKPGRTTISLTIFALVAFTLVAIAGTGSSLDASLGQVVEEQSGGYTLVAFSASSAPELPELVASNATLAPYFSEVVPLDTGGITVRAEGSGLAPIDDSLYAGVPGVPPSSDFYTTNRYSYSATEDGMSAAQIATALATEPGVAVVDQSYSTTPNNLATSPASGHPTVNPGARLLLTNPANGNTTVVTVLGVMTQSALTGVFVSPATASSLGIGSENLFLMTVAPGHSASEAELLAKTAFFPYGLVVIDFSGAIAKTIATTEGEIGLLQIFVSLGLIVGIAAMGIVALRAVVERRRDIGMLRANGFTEGMMVRAFLLEYSFVTLLGLAIGTLLGLLIVWNLTHGPEGVSTSVTVFAMPWTNLAVILVGAYALSMLAVAGPTRAAARLPPAVAVRPVE